MKLWNTILLTLSMLYLDCRKLYLYIHRELLNNGKYLVISRVRETKVLRTVGIEIIMIFCYYYFFFVKYSFYFVFYLYLMLILL